MSERALGRALLARQGLLERFEGPLTETVEAVGAMQGQAWGALPVGLWSRMSSFSPADLYGALERGELLWGIGIRGTLHLLSAREHPAYAVVALEPTGAWHREIGETTPGMDELRDGVLAFAKGQPRTNEEIGLFAEDWVARHPGKIDEREVQAQRSLKWRPIYRWSALVRVPAGGAWGAKTPADHRAAPIPPGKRGAPTREQALERVTIAHLGAFGPAAAADVACWTGARVPTVRALLEGMGEQLVAFEDETGRTLYDLPQAPRPDPDTPAPPRLLGAFDSSLLAYAVKRRTRIVPESLREVVYDKGNLRIQPTILLNGLVAGTWSVEARRGQATLTLRPAGKLKRADRAALTGEAEGLLEGLYADTKGRRVVVE
ncbi:MAG: winged helix DNA-binding domain-containing protein [Solirubrobacteraceae bacterium]